MMGPGVVAKLMLNKKPEFTGVDGFLHTGSAFGRIACFSTVIHSPLDNSFGRLARGVGEAAHTPYLGTASMPAPGMYIM